MKVNNYPLKTPAEGDKLFGSDSNGDQAQFDVTVLNPYIVNLNSAGGSETLVNDGTGPTLAVKGISASNGITLSSTATALTINGAYKYEIGEYVPSEGGVIFHKYLDGGNQNYLVVSINYQSFSQAWSNITSTSIGGSARSSWDGLSNSNAIVGQSGFTSGAAKLCLDLISLDKNDWYLPSMHELNFLWQNLFNVNRTLSGNSSYGSIAGAEEVYLLNHWSSTESASGTAWSILYGDGNIYTFSLALKSATFSVRAIRKFSI
jgi:hypothetical protein